MTPEEREDRRREVEAAAPIVDETMPGPDNYQRRDFADAHAEGLHEIAREFCPECEAEGRRA